MRRRASGSLVPAGQHRPPVPLAHIRASLPYSGTVLTMRARRPGGGPAAPPEARRIAPSTTLRPL
eukprot:3855558-Lingulodinium_polyedra.AAC.1